MAPPSQSAPSGNLSAEFLAEDISGTLLGTCISFMMIETVFVFLMFASRFLAKTDQKANVWMTMLMTAGYMVCLGKITVGILMVQIGGAGRHMAAIDMPSKSNLLKLTTVLQITCPLATSLTKLSILCLLYQILGKSAKIYRTVIKATFGLMLCILIIQVIIPFANCKPFSKTWTPWGPGSCAVPALNLWRYLSIPNVVTTIIMIGIPLPALYKLKVSTPTKMGLGLVFSVCLIGVVAAIGRFSAFLEVKNFDDISFENITPLSWTIAESGIYLIAGVMPTLRPLMRKVCGGVQFDKILSRGSTMSISATWGNKRASKMVWAKPLPPVPEEKVEIPPVPEKDVEIYEIGYPASVRSSKSTKADPRDTIFSAQEQSVIVMMEREFV